MRGRAAPPRGRNLRLAALAVPAALILIQADNYFGDRSGKLAFLILGALLLGSMLLDFAGNLHRVRHPRKVDFLFVAGASREQRVTLSVRATLTSARLHPVLPLIAAVLVGAAKGHGPIYIAAVVGSILLEAAVICVILASILKSGLLPVSTRRYSGSDPSALGFLGRRSGAFWIAPTDSLARVLSGFLGPPYAWMLRRRLLCVFRTDPVSCGIYAGLILILATAFSLHWNARGAAAFAVVGTMLTLTLLQLATDACDTLASEAPYLVPGGWIDCRSRLALFLPIAAGFSGFYAVAALWHDGASALSGSVAFPQTLATCLGFPFLLLADTPGRPARPARRLSTDNRVLMNICYLGIAGILFILGGAGLVAGLAVLAWAAHASLRKCRRGYWRPAAPAIPGPGSGGNATPQGMAAGSNTETRPPTSTRSR